ncbi:PadR family transcriptional regulator [candidate division KSB1 bacterium]
MEEITRKEEHILLSVNSLSDNAYLITIRDQVKNFTGKLYSVGTIYAPLNRLHINGYLESILEKAENGKPIRYYKLTKKGFHALEELRKLNNEMWEGFAVPVFKD